MCVCVFITLDMFMGCFRNGSLFLFFLTKDHTYSDDNYVWLHICQLCVRASASSLDDDEDRTVVRKEKDGWKIKFSSQKPATPLLDTINYPAHMKNLSLQVNHFKSDNYFLVLKSCCWSMACTAVIFLSFCRFGI